MTDKQDHSISLWQYIAVADMAGVRHHTVTNTLSWC